MKIDKILSPKRRKYNACKNFLRLQDELNILSQYSGCDRKTKEVKEIKDELELYGNRILPFDILSSLYCYVKTNITLAHTTKDDVVSDNIILLETIASGAFGSVYQAKLKKISDMVVAKVAKNETMKEELLHELFIGTFCTNFLRKKIPNFSFVIGSFQCSLPIDKKEKWCDSSSSFDKQYNYVLYEKINGDTLGDALKIDIVDVESFVSYLFQLVFSLLIAFSQCKFIHYDLHSANIILRDYERRYTLHKTKFLLRYDLPDGQSFYVKTDKIATIIDYGYSAISIVYGAGRNKIEKRFGVYGLEYYGQDPDNISQIFDMFKFLGTSYKTSKNKEIKRFIAILFPFFGIYNEEDIRKQEADKFMYRGPKRTLNEFLNFLVKNVPSIENNIIYKEKPKGFEVAVLADPLF